MGPIELTQLLVRCDTVNPPGREAGCIEPLADLLSDAGFRCETFAHRPGRPSLIARLPGRRGALPLAFTGHVDVVPLGAAAWSRDPFGAEIVDGRLYGRGSSDMKSGVAALTVAAIAAAERAGDAAGLVVVITAGEETGCDGAFHLVNDERARAALGRAGALVVAEPTGNQAWLGHKGAFWLRAQAHGRTAHGSMPAEGDNAVYKIARAALALEAMADVDGVSHERMGPATLNVGTVAGGLNINSVPDTAELSIDIRTVEGQDHDALFRCLCERLGPHIGLTRLLDVAPVWTDPSDSWVQRVLELVRGHAAPASTQQVATFFTDAAALRPALGMPPTVILGPGEPTQAHQTDEYCEVAKILSATAIFTALAASSLPVEA